MNLYLTLIAITLFCLTAQTESLSLLFTWDHHLIISGQWWRILSGNFTHTNLNHLVMNMAALWLISLIFKPTGKQLLTLLTVISILIGLGLFLSDIQRYVGISGTLHGLFVYCALGEITSGRRTSWLLVAGIVFKVAWEQWAGPSSLSENLIGAPVAIQAHLIGLLSGTGLFLIAILKQNRRPG